MSRLRRVKHLPPNCAAGRERPSWPFIMDLTLNRFTRDSSPLASDVEEKLQSARRASQATLRQSLQLLPKLRNPDSSAAAVCATASRAVTSNYC